MGIPVLARFRENKIRESQFYCHSRNLNPSKIMPCIQYLTSHLLHILSLLLQVASQGNSDSIAMYNSQLSQLRHSVHFSGNAVPVPSYMEKYPYTMLCISA